MTPTQPSSRELYLRLLSYVRPHWKVFAVAIMTMVCSAATEPLFPALMRPLLDSGFTGRSTQDIYVLPAMLVGIFVLRGIFSYVSAYTLQWVSNRVVMDMRVAMFNHALKLPTRYYDDQSKGMLMSRIAYDAGGVTAAATNVLTVLVRDSLAVVGLLGWLLYLNWKLTLIALTVAPVVAIVVSSFSGRLRRVGREGQHAMGEMVHVIEEAFGAHKVVKVFGGQAYEEGRFRHVSNRLRGLLMRSAIAAAAVVPLVQIATAVALAAIIAIALQQATDNGTTVGSFVSFITAMLMLLAPVRHLTDLNAPLQRGLAAAESVFAMLDEQPEEDLGTERIDRARGEVALERVSFSYPNASAPALDDVSLAIEPGMTVALVGPSGGGKTTLVDLIPRFHHPQAGRILVDGRDIESLALDSLRAQVALVSQDVVLFNDTVAANIAYGVMQQAPRAAIEAAAHAAHAHDFITAMPAGYDTLVGENGVKLSGGQRQRLAIARAILKNAPILILDEATSALDSESERQVQAALDSLMRNRTTIVIAHRLSTIEKADRIVVLERGRIVETGSHSELLARAGTYARLYRIQYAHAAQDAGALAE